MLYDRIAAMQKGIVQFTVLTEAEKPIVDKPGFPVLLDLISLRIPFPQRGIYTTGKFIKADIKGGQATYQQILLKNPNNASTRLSMNGKFLTLSIPSPFALSKGERKFFSRILSVSLRFGLNGGIAQTGTI